MVDKLSLNCSSNEITEIVFTTGEIKQCEQEEQQRLDQELLDSLIPSKEEMLLAEVEINTITLLMEVGLL